MNEFDNIEELFKRKLEHHQANVRPELWQRIKARLPQVKTPLAHSGAASKMLLVKVAATVFAVAGITVGSYFIFRKADNITIKQTRTALNRHEKSSKTVDKPQTNLITTAHSKQSAANGASPAKQGLASKAVNQNTDKPKTATRNIHHKPNNATAQHATQDLGSNVTQNSDNNTANKHSNKQVAVADKDQTPVSSTNKNNSQNTSSASKTLPAISIPDSIDIVVSKFSDFQANSIIFSCTTNAPYVSWNFGDGSSGANKKQGTHDYADVGTYTITATIYNKDGKKITQKSTEVTFKEKSAILFIPNVISPNGDGLNDVFKIKVLNIKSLTLKIFEGNKIVFQSENADADNMWNGNDMSGNPLPSGQYHYVITAIGNDGNALEPKAGTITVTR